MSGSGRIVAIGSGGKESGLWDLRNNRLRIFNNPDDVLAVAISPNSRLLATAGQDKNISVYDVSTGRLTRTLRGHDSDVRIMTFTGDGKHLVSAGDDKLLLVWNIQNGTRQQIMRGHSDNVVHLAASRDGQRVVSGENKRSGGLVILWDTLKGQELRRYRFEKKVDLLGMTPDARLLVVGSGKELTGYRMDQ